MFKKPTFLIIPALALLLIGAGCETDFNADLSNNTDTGADTEATDIDATQRSEVETSFESRLDTWVSDYNSWRTDIQADLAVASEATREEFLDEWEEMEGDMEETYQEAVETYNDLQNATAEEWDNLRVEAEDRIQNLESLLEEARTEFTVDASADADADASVN